MDIYPLNLFGTHDAPDDEQLAWWIQVSMHSPASVMYFGPFDTYREAESQLAGYVDDLQQEGATELVADIQRCHSESLTFGDVA
ncbi:MAG: DUF1816 domain-containing protein [Cyanobacteria bacterium J06648_11]